MRWKIGPALQALLWVSALQGQVPSAPDGTYTDHAGLFSRDEERMIRMRQDFFTSGARCPIYLAALPSAQGRPPEEFASEVFSQWHAREKRLPDDALLIVVLAQERAARVVLGPAVPAAYEAALASLPPTRWEGNQPAGVEVEKLLAALDDRLSPIGRTLSRSRLFVPPVARSFLIDGMENFSDRQRREIESGLADLASSSGHPVLVALDVPGLPLATGDFGAQDIQRWTGQAFAAWSRDRPELDNGAVLFLFTSRFSATIRCGGRVAGRVSPASLEDLQRDLSDARLRGFFDKALLRVAGSLDERFSGKKPLSVRSLPYALLHPWRLVAGPDEPVPLGLKLGASAVLLYLLAWFLWLSITHPRMMLFAFGGTILSELIGGAVSGVVGGGGGGGYSGGGGSFGGGGASGTW